MPIRIGCAGGVALLIAQYGGSLLFHLVSGYRFKSGPRDVPPTGILCAARVAFWRDRSVRPSTSDNNSHAFAGSGTGDGVRDGRELLGNPGTAHQTQEAGSCHCHQIDVLPEGVAAAGRSSQMYTLT
jgi:hypothetical protein